MDSHFVLCGVRASVHNTSDELIQINWQIHRINVMNSGSGVLPFQQMKRQRQRQSKYSLQTISRILYASMIRLQIPEIGSKHGYTEPVSCQCELFKFYYFGVHHLTRELFLSIWRRRMECRI